MVDNGQKGEKKKLLKKLKNRYRLVLMHEQTFEEKKSISLTPLNVIIIFSLLFFFIAGITVVSIVYTPVKEYIIGYPSSQVMEKATHAALKADSLQVELYKTERYLDNLKKILTGNIDDADSAGYVEKQTYTNLEFTPSAEDSAFRADIEAQSKYNLSISQKREISDMRGVFFFTPIRGVVTQAFNLKKKHFGVDIAAPENEMIKTVLDGTVIMSTWTYDTGYVIYIQHDHDLVSVYKHNSMLLKEKGDKVKAGDPIAVIGNTGELSDGPHLHFELWYNGQPMNPQDYIIFD
jgi:murein DD-endopeptidase MepM/ murein hydrolase activator NlpD